jgi:hypothetical protein
VSLDRGRRGRTQDNNHDFKTESSTGTLNICRANRSLHKALLTTGHGRDQVNDVEYSIIISLRYAKTDIDAMILSDRTQPHASLVPSSEE